MPKLQKTIMAATPVVKEPKKTAKKPIKILVKSHTKQGIVINLLQRAQGATVNEMAEATCWQRHSVYGLLYGALKKQGLVVAGSEEQRGRVYRVA